MIIWVNSSTTLTLEISTNPWRVVPNSSVPGDPVVGVPDAEWGECVCAALVPAAGASPSVEDVRAFAKERLAPYKVPKQLRIVDELPRNAMGKVTKPDVRELFRTDEAE